MSTLNNQFGSIVRQSRESRGWSQEVLADRANLNRSYLGEVERGSAMPSLATIEKLARAFNTSMSDLVARAEQIRPEQPRAEAARAEQQGIY